MVAFSPDGQHLVYAANDQLYLRAMDQLDANLISAAPTMGRLEVPFFPPMGNGWGLGLEANSRRS